jgi:hypothetical protein
MNSNDFVHKNDKIFSDVSDDHDYSLKYDNKDSLEKTYFNKFKHLGKGLRRYKSKWGRYSKSHYKYKYKDFDLTETSDKMIARYHLTDNYLPFDFSGKYNPENGIKYDNKSDNEHFDDEHFDDEHFDDEHFDDKNFDDKNFDALFDDINYDKIRSNELYKLQNKPKKHMHHNHRKVHHMLTLRRIVRMSNFNKNLYMARISDLKYIRQRGILSYYNDPNRLLDDNLITNHSIVTIINLSKLNIKKLRGSGYCDTRDPMYRDQSGDNKYFLHDFVGNLYNLGHLFHDTLGFNEFKNNVDEILQIIIDHVHTPILITCDDCVNLAPAILIAYAIRVMGYKFADAISMTDEKTSDIDKTWLNLTNPTIRYFMRQLSTMPMLIPTLFTDIEHDTGIQFE